tara:strand:+ start:244 stop:480 length:237 start_codon:yes stop_codon:yes gene_type:complete
MKRAYLSRVYASDFHGAFIKDIAFDVTRGLSEYQYLVKAAIIDGEKHYFFETRKKGQLLESITFTSLQKLKKHAKEII